MRFGAVALAVVLGTVTEAQGPISRTSGSGVVSPSVVATTIVVYPSADRARLQLLVLWRGSPGWMTKGGRSSSGGGSRGTGPSDEDYPLFSQLSYGDVNLNLTFRPGAHKLTIGNDDVPLGPDDNVVLVDHVDGREGPKVLKTLHIDSDAAPTITQGPSAMPMVTAQEFVRRSPELVEYLQCDVPTSDPNGAVQHVMTLLCQQLR